MVARPAPGTFSVAFSGFMGSLNDCMKECQYDNFCKGVLYSTSYSICTKMVQVDTTDDPWKVDDFRQNWVAYVKSDAIITYYANYCGQFNLQPSCTPAMTQGQCAWGVLPVGTNQNRAHDEGWCGRIACNRALG
jgi:hypothetical protein